MRRALAIQLIINREWGLAMNENPLQGSFVVDELTDLVEEAVLAELEAISARGGVLGAMETGYQRGRIQDESLPLRARQARRLDPHRRRQHLPQPRRRRGARRASSSPAPTTPRSRTSCGGCATSSRATPTSATACSTACRQAALDGGNVFAVLMDAVRCCSLGQITDALFEVGGRYRRNV